METEKEKNCFDELYEQLVSEHNQITNVHGSNFTPEFRKGYEYCMSDVGLISKELTATLTEQNAKLSAENKNLKTVMIAAAEEIQKHWQSHCDTEGYGPANLMHRLEKGIPSQYGYTAGSFEKLESENAKLKEALTKIEGMTRYDENHDNMLYSIKEVNEFVKSLLSSPLNS